jgi:hypothetical protein
MQDGRRFVTFEDELNAAIGGLEKAGYGNSFQVKILRRCRAALSQQESLISTLFTILEEAGYLDEYEYNHESWDKIAGDLVRNAKNNLPPVQPPTAS